MHDLAIFTPPSRDYTNRFSSYRKEYPVSAELQKLIAEHEKDWATRNERLQYATEKDIHQAHEVHPGIYIGSYYSVADVANGKLKVNAILNMAIECNYQITGTSVQVTKIGIEDCQITPDGVYEQAADVIARAKAQDLPILVHCAAGISRSSTAVLSYLMLHEGMGWSPALHRLRLARGVVNPNPELLKSVIRDFGAKFLP